MFKTEEQINSRLNSERNLVNRFVVNFPEPAAPTVPESSETIIEDKVETRSAISITTLEQPGNKPKKKLSKEDRTEIAFRSRSGERQPALAQEFNVSQPAIGAIERGETKTDEFEVNRRLDAIQDVAMSKLLESLGFITAEKLEKSKAGELSVIAANMGKVVNNMLHRNEQSGPVVNVNVFAPELRNERTFKTIEV